MHVDVSSLQPPERPAEQPITIGYFQHNDWHPPKAGSRIHAYQVAAQLSRLGHNLQSVFLRYSDPRVENFRRRRLFSFMRKLDLVYIRPHPTAKRPEILTLMKFLRFRQVPVVWEINAPLEEFSLIGYDDRAVERFVRSQRFLARFVDACICNTEALAEYSRNTLGVLKNFVVPLGSDPEMFSPCRRDNSIYPGNERRFKVVWAGTPRFPWHGVERIFEVARRVYELDPEILFVLIGTRSPLEKCASEVPNVLLVDEMSYLDIPPYIASADVGLCIYEHEGLSTEFYRSPLKLFDYMASGLGVVAPAWGQIREIVRHRKRGLLVQNGVEEYVDAILYLKNNRERLREFGIAARREIERYYNWQRVGEDTERILLDLA